jgi:hypothetical protein
VLRLTEFVSTAVKTPNGMIAVPGLEGGSRYIPSDRWKKVNKFSNHR